MGAEYLHVGGLHPEAENDNGCMMREFLKRTGMIAVNTNEANGNGGGKTWYSEYCQKGTRVDYVLVDEELWRMGGHTDLCHRTWRTIRALARKRCEDHVPVQWQTKNWGGPNEEVREIGGMILIWGQ